jgi:hypothetical protein
LAVRPRAWESLLSRETIAHHVGEVELFMTRCAEIVAEEARRADEPDPPADYGAGDAPPSKVPDPPC